jgi:hypothetical protein
VSDGPIPLLGVPALPPGYSYKVDDGLFGPFGLVAEVRVRIIHNLAPLRTLATGYAFGELHWRNADKQVAKAAQRAYERFNVFQQYQAKVSRFAHGIRALGMSVAV